MTHPILFIAILFAAVTLSGKDSTSFAAGPGSAGGTLGKTNKTVSGGVKRFRPDDEFQDCDDCPKMVVVPKGSFMMGSLESWSARAPLMEWYGEPNERPRHKVRITRTFAAGKFEVTFTEWDACVSQGGCNGYRPGDEGWGRGRRPVINVSWDDAMTYVAWLSRKTEKSYRLLSEAEWEYAARALTAIEFSRDFELREFSTGWRITTDQANFNGNYTYHRSRKGRFRKKTVSVGSFAENAFGLHDMHGNVWEWVEDCWKDSYRSGPSDGRSRTSSDCSQRVQRGGSWGYGPMDLRFADRNGLTSGVRSIFGGFRVARTLLTP